MDVLEIQLQRVALLLYRVCRIILICFVYEKYYSDFS